MQGFQLSYPLSEYERLLSMDSFRKTESDQWLRSRIERHPESAIARWTKVETKRTDLPRKLNL